MKDGFENEVSRKIEILNEILTKVQTRGVSVVNVSKSINRIGGLSYYTTFATPNGEKIYIRLSDHETGVSRAMTEIQINVVSKIYKGEKTVEDAVDEIVSAIDSVIARREAKRAEEKALIEKRKNEIALSENYTVDQIIELFAQKEIDRADTQSKSIFGVALIHLYNYHKKGKKIGFSEGHRAYHKHVADMKKAILDAKIELVKYLEKM